MLLNMLRAGLGRPNHIQVVPVVSSILQPSDVPTRLASRGKFALL